MSETQKIPQSVAVPRDRRIIPINAEVRSLLGLYLSMFRNYDEAARAVEVSKDTIAKYFEGNPNIAFYVFRRMVNVMQERLPAEKIQAAIAGTKIDDLFSMAQERNGQQIDNVMYEISEGLLKVLNFYTEQFPSRAKAAQKVDVNPRTFKAYLKGDIRSFPRRKFEAMIEVLEEKGHTQAQVLKRAGVKTLEELLSAKVRLETLNLSKQDIIAEIKKLFEQGTLKNNLIEKRLRNAANRIFGNFGNAVREAMRVLEKELHEKIEADIDKADFADAFKEIRTLERYIQIYAAKERAITRSAGPAAKKRWKDEVLAMSQRKNKFKAVVFKALRLNEAAGVPSDLGTFDEEPIEYSPEQTYEPGNILVHPEYGLGHVLEINDDRQAIITFGPKVGEKTLVMSQRRGGPEFWGR
ncbi:MAG: hypothetical protein KDH09_20190 [Chrysiogenetes bacterium]|nr:hypothetical protein [Chrysiogenetes bacterium]